MVKTFEKNCGLHKIIKMMSDSNSHIQRWLFLLSWVSIYIFYNLVTFTVSLWLILIIHFKKNVNVNNKLLSLMIHVGYEGSNHCRRNLHKPLTLGYFFCNVAALISIMNCQTKSSLLFKCKFTVKFWREDFVQLLHFFIQSMNKKYYVKVFLKFHFEGFDCIWCYDKQWASYNMYCSCRDCVCVQPWFLHPLYRQISLWSVI